MSLVRPADIFVCQLRTQVTVKLFSRRKEIYFFNPYSILWSWHISSGGQNVQLYTVIIGIFDQIFENENTNCDFMKYVGYFYY